MARTDALVLGAGIDVKVASSEDVVIALNNASAEEAEATDTTSALPREDDIESLRDLASGAPVVPGLRRKLIWTTVISAIIFAASWLAYNAGLLNVERLSRLMGFPF